MARVLLEERGAAVVEAEVAGALAQFGVAGMVGAMWLLERRWAAARERQLTELHERLMADRREGDAVIAALRDSTRAMTGVEHGLRSLTALVERAVWPEPRVAKVDAAGAGGG